MALDIPLITEKHFEGYGIGCHVEQTPSDRLYAP